MIDVIIPAYNAHDTIYNCLFSILNQNIKNLIKVYVIDDYSDNKYDDVFNFFKDKLNIKLIRLDSNHGPGYARQIGIEKSNSKYIIFIDSDDVFFDSYSVENIYKTIIDKDYDLVFSNMIEKDEDRIIERNGGIFSLHGKIFKREFINKNSVSFPNYYTDEDVSFNYLFLLNNPIIGYCPSKVYTYRRKKNSLTKNNEYDKGRHIDNFCKNINWVMDYAENNKIQLERIGALLSFSFAYLYYYFSFKTNLKDKSIKYLYSLVTHYNKYKNYINKDILEKDIEEWFSLKNKHQFNISFNEFINILKKGYEEAKK